MGQEDYRHLNNVEDRTYQGRRNPLKLHSKLSKCQKISRSQRENMIFTICLQGQSSLSEWKNHGRYHLPSVDGAFPREPWDSNFYSWIQLTRKRKGHELTEAPPSISIQDTEEKAYRQWWADDAGPPRDPFLLEHSWTLADEGLWQEEKCV